MFNIVVEITMIELRIKSCFFSFDRDPFVTIFCGLCNPRTNWRNFTVRGTLIADMLNWYCVVLYHGNLSKMTLC